MKFNYFATNRFNIINTYLNYPAAPFTILKDVTTVISFIRDEHRCSKSFFKKKKTDSSFKLPIFDKVIVSSSILKQISGQVAPKMKISVISKPPI